MGMRPLLVRLGVASEAFSQLRSVWADSGSGLGLKLHLFRAAVLSVMAHGSEAWWLCEKAVVKLRSWGARCLARVTGREVREEYLAPTVSVVGNLRVRRLRWLGHVLRLPEESLLRRVVLMEHTRLLQEGRLDRVEGGLWMDAPEHSCVEEVQELAEDREGWRMWVEMVAEEQEPEKVVRTVGTRRSTRVQQRQQRAEEEQR